MRKGAPTRYDLISFLFFSLPFLSVLLCQLERVESLVFRLAAQSLSTDCFWVF